MSSTPTSIHPRRFQCRHVFTDGHRCGSPCLRDEDFCFYHHASRGRSAQAAIPTIDLSQGEHRASPLTLPIPEDRSAIQHAIGEVLTRLASNQLDPRRAGLILYGLQIASANLPQTPAGQPPAPVEEVVTDPDLGTVAPRTEIIAHTEHHRRTLTEMLLADLLRGPSDPEPDILSDLNAAAVHCHLRPHQPIARLRVGFARQDVSAW